MDKRAGEQETDGRHDQLRLLIIDVSKPGGEGATGKLSRTLFGDWPRGKLLHLYWGSNWSWRLYDGERCELVSLDQVMERCRSFQPDLIYYRPVAFPTSFHQTALWLIDQLEVPFVVHLMDDWLKRLESRGAEIFPVFDSSVRSLLKNAACCLSICDDMSEAFSKRYDVPFYSLGNGVEFEPDENSVSKKGEHRPFTLRYCGGLENDMTRQSVKRLAEVVSSLSGRIPLRLEVYCKVYDHLTAASDLLGMEGVRVFETVPDSEYKRLLQESDALAIVYNFDKESLDYIRYSFANKLPECLATGRPILGFGPSDCATIRYLRENDCALVVDTDDSSELEKAVEELVRNASLREQLGERAKTVARESFLLASMRRKMVEIFASAVNVAPKEYRPSAERILLSCESGQACRFDEDLFVRELLSGDEETDSGIQFQGMAREHSRKSILYTSDEVGASSVVNVREMEGSQLELLRNLDWETDNRPVALIVPFEDLESEKLGYNMHQLAIFLSRKGYEVLVSEWFRGYEKWRRLSLYPNLLVDPLASGRLIAFKRMRKTLDLKAVANAQLQLGG